VSASWSTAARGFAKPCLKQVAGILPTAATDLQLTEVFTKIRRGSPQRPIEWARAEAMSRAAFATTAERFFALRLGCVRFATRWVSPKRIGVIEKPRYSPKASKRRRRRREGASSAHPIVSPPLGMLRHGIACDDGVPTPR